PALAGAVRAHGANGAFVSEWVIDKTTLQVVSGKDLMHDVWLFDTATQTYVDHNAALGNGVSFSRFCSADLADANAFYNPAPALRLPTPPMAGSSSTARRTTPKAGRWRTLSEARRTATATSSPGSATWLTRISSPIPSPATRPWWGCSTTRRRLAIMPPAPPRFRETIAARSTSTSATSRRPASRSPRPASPAP